jgi:glycerol-3-phosphate dehydrogenase subunit B
MQELGEKLGYPLVGSLERNWLLPTVLGVPRPTCLAPKSMVAGDIRSREPMLLVGFEQFLDFFPGLAVANLVRFGVPVEEISLDLASLRKLRFLSASVLARLFEEEEFLDEVIAAVKPRLGGSARVGFPAVLGIENSTQIHQALESGLGRPVFEMPGLPPSIPGIRLHNLLIEAARRTGAKIFNGMLVSGASVEARRVTSVMSEAAARWVAHPAKMFLLATGGLLGGGLVAEKEGYLRETALNLEIESSADASGLFREQSTGHPGHPVYQSGVIVNPEFQPVDDTGKVLYQNLFAAGGTLAGGDYLRERSLDGVALVTGYLAAENLVRTLSEHRVIR